VRKPSIRWALVLPPMALATLVAALLVVLQHWRERDQLMRQLERTLATKCEEVHSVLRSGATAEELAAFLEVETRYLNSPYEYFYEIADDDGAPLLASTNLHGRRLLPSATNDQGMALLAHPHREDESVRARRELLDTAIPGWHAARMTVAVSLDPLEAAVRAGMVESLLVAVAGLAALLLTLWFVVGRTLRRVAAITRHAATITSSNLRERLPTDGRGDELDELTCVFNRMLADLGRAIAQMEAFTSDAAHQLRTPLTRARGALDLVLREREGLSASIRLRVEETREELERLGRTCSRLLLLARLDSGALEQGLLAEEVDLSALVHEVVEQFGPLAAERGVELTWSGCEPLPMRCSRPLLLEALLNLLDNALRVSARGQEIEVSLRSDADAAVVTIADQGPGIPEHAREQVFQRFFRLAPSAGDGGTGLGLAIVRGIARAHGGEVHIEASQWGGAAVRLSLPQARRSLSSISSASQPILSSVG